MILCHTNLVLFYSSSYLIIPIILILCFTWFMYIRLGHSVDIFPNSIYFSILFGVLSSFIISMCLIHHNHLGFKNVIILNLLDTEYNLWLYYLFYTSFFITFHKDSTYMNFCKNGDNFGRTCFESHGFRLQRHLNFL